MQMDKDYIEQFDVIRRYHQNKLNDDELNSFEVYILENPDIINVIEKEKAIHDAFRENESLLNSDENKPAGIPWGRGFAIAASLFVAVVAVFSFQGNPDYMVQPPVVLETFRGAGDNTFQVSGEPIVQFQIDMGPAELLDNNNFNVELVDAAGNPVFRSTGLSADAEGWLYFILEDQSDLLAGIHEVRVYPADNDIAISSYEVEFINP